ncbi:hypothetical protein QQP08_019575 [Theobroma cacao]|nr:hypothetical protein QQP08_019575 [Theobroma cacao]
MDLCLKQLWFSIYLKGLPLLLIWIYHIMLNEGQEALFPFLVSSWCSKLFFDEEFFRALLIFSSIFASHRALPISFKALVLVLLSESGQTFVFKVKFKKLLVFLLED